MKNNVQIEAKYIGSLKGNERKVDQMARTTFGDNYESAIFGGYVRIFAEFLGHMAVSQPQLFLEKYKEKIIEKIT